MLYNIQNYSPEMQVLFEYSLIVPECNSSFDVMEKTMNWAYDSNINVAYRDLFSGDSNATNDRQLIYWPGDMLEFLFTDERDMTEFILRIN